MRSKFINPYHFMPLKDKKTIVADNETEEKYSGYIQVQIKNRTPMIIPNPYGKEDSSREKTLNFFTYYEEYEGNSGTEGENIAYKHYPPVIPGSSIRGMLRSVYEMATNSCMSVLDKKTVVSRRISDPGQPGVLHKNGNKMELYMEVETVGKIDPNSVKDRAECSPYKIQGKEGILVKGESFDGKKCHVFFPPQNSIGVKRINISEEDLWRFEQVLRLYADKTVNKKLGPDHSGYKEYAKCYKDFKNSAQNALEYFPVYYSELKLKGTGGKGGKVVYYLAPAQISREVYKTQPADIVKDTYAPCLSLDSLCPACRLFGMVGSSDALASKVRITDGTFVDSVNEVKGGGYEVLYYEEPKVLEELASPKPGNMEFYYKQPEGANFWTPDYYSKNGTLYQNSKLELMGRKFYWHHANERLPEDVEKTERNSRVRLLKKGKTFSYRVYFEDITKTEIQRLIYLCNISSEKDQDGAARYGYHLGLGKPLGLGSVEMVVDDVRIRRWLSESDGIQIRPLMQEYKSVFNSSWQDEATYSAANFEGNKELLLRMLQFTAAGKTPITYPVADDQSMEVMSEGFKFFVNNKYQLKRDKYENGGVLGRKKVIVQQHLKPFTGAVQTLNTNKENVIYETIERLKSMQGEKEKFPNGKNKNGKGQGGNGQKKGSQKEKFTGTVSGANPGGYQIKLDENPKLKYKTGFISRTYLDNKGIELHKGEKLQVSIFKENEQRKNYMLNYINKC